MRANIIFDEFAEDTIKDLNIPPWKRNFIRNYYNLLKKKNEQVHKQNPKSEITQNDIVELVNEKAKNSTLLAQDYKLTSSKLNAHVKFEDARDDAEQAQKRCTRKLDVSDLIGIANAFGVSVDYMLGIDECETPGNDTIYKKTGLNNNSIDILRNNKYLQKSFNMLLEHSEFIDILHAIESDFYTRFANEELLKHYSSVIIEKIEPAFKKYYETTFPLNRTQTLYRKYLKEAFPQEKFDTVFLESNVSRDFISKINDIQEKYPNHSLYACFIAHIADTTYPLLEYKYIQRPFIIHNITQSFIELLDSYYFTKAPELRQAIKESAVIMDKRNSLPKTK